jgi:hypothetical protein
MTAIGIQLLILDVGWMDCKRVMNYWVTLHQNLKIPLHCILIWMAFEHKAFTPHLVVLYQLPCPSLRSNKFTNPPYLTISYLEFPRLRYPSWSFSATFHTEGYPRSSFTATFLNSGHALACCSQEAKHLTSTTISPNGSPEGTASPPFLRDNDSSLCSFNCPLFPRLHYVPSQWWFHLHLLLFGWRD